MFCDRPVPGEYENQHHECFLEMVRRNNEEKCLRCGKEPVWNNDMCERCNIDDAPYVGYPPGGA